MIARLYARLWLDVVYRDRWWVVWTLAVKDVALWLVSTQRNKEVDEDENALFE